MWLEGPYPLGLAEQEWMHQIPSLMNADHPMPCPWWIHHRDPWVFLVPASFCISLLLKPPGAPGLQRMWMTKSTICSYQPSHPLSSCRKKKQVKQSVMETMEVTGERERRKKSISPLRESKGASLCAISHEPYPFNTPQSHRPSDQVLKTDTRGDGAELCVIYVHRHFRGIQNKNKVLSS